jgi:hypothetical protein
MLCVYAVLSVYLYFVYTVCVMCVILHPPNLPDPEKTENRTINKENLGKPQTNQLLVKTSKQTTNQPRLPSSQHKQPQSNTITTSHNAMMQISSSFFQL